MSEPNIDIIVDRDPDGDTTLTVFIDGKRIENYGEHHIDPGRGYSRADWDERIEAVEEMPDSQLKNALLDSLVEAADSKWIED
ncbi:hypothetical protein SEA_OBLADI_160 [Gordonia phage ObLaDi]|uniref:Uncharacterized protein n=2 Tax=Cafassovirus TaxID=3425056 RepID=A0A9E7QF29_9CAUD|nr:hypothetical protein SEA_ALEEMILY_158 [Gordonia phage Aleemily]UXE03883.1 hypothetical protein SEA_OBLADI_160 [Gordonia phage ObLaDi]